MASKKLVLSADGTTATVADAAASDIVTTALSMDSALTGFYGKAQLGLAFLGGMVTQNVRNGNGINVFQRG